MKSLLPPRSDPQLERPAGEGVGRGGGSYCGTKGGLRPTLIITHKQHFSEKKTFILLKSSEFANYKTIFKPPIISS